MKYNLVSRLCCWSTIIISLFAFTGNTKAADFYWVGGNGQWTDFSHHWAQSSGGTVFYTQVPTAFDNVFFDNNSFPLTNDTSVIIDLATVTCKDMTWNTGNKKIYILSQGEIDRVINTNGSLLLATGVQTNYSITFLMKAPAPAIITSNGASTNSIFRLDDPTGIWNITDSLVTTRIELMSGELNAQNKIIRANDFISSSSSTRTLDIRNGVLETTRIFESQIPGFIVKGTAGKIKIHIAIASDSPISIDTIECMQDYMGYQIRNVSGYKLIGKAGSVELINGSSFSTININTGLLDLGNNPSVTDLTLTNVKKLIWEGTFTIQNIINTSSCAAMPLIEGGTMSKSSGTLTLDNVRIASVTAIGGATFICTNAMDLGGNTGMLFTTPRVGQTFYWIGNGGQWTDPAHWSLSSGGAPYHCIPYELDHVIMDQNSFSVADETVQIQGNGCTNFDIGQINQSVLIEGPITVFGSLKLSSLLKEYSLNLIFFRSPTMATMINFNKAVLPHTTINFDGNGEWILADSLNCELITFNKGTLRTASKRITCDRWQYHLYESATQFHIDLESSEVHIKKGDLEVKNEGQLSINASSSFIYLYGRYYLTLNGVVAFNEIHTQPGSQGTLSYSYQGSSIKKLYIHDQASTGYYTIDSLILYAGARLNLFAGGQISVNGIKIINTSPSCIPFTSITSETEGAWTKISKSNGTVNLDHVLLRDIKATGGATFNATSSINDGGNTGWNFTSGTSKTFYWIGNSGDVYDPTHWSLSSGGISANCIPSPIDNVIFDENSFSLATQTISSSKLSFTINNLSVLNLSAQQRLDNFTLEIRGNTLLHQYLSLSPTTKFFIRGAGNHHLTSNNVHISNIQLFMKDTLIIEDNLHGEIMTSDYCNIDFNEKNIDFKRMTFYFGVPCYFDMRNSKLSTKELSITGKIITSIQGSEITLLNSPISAYDNFCYIEATPCPDTATFNVINVKRLTNYPFPQERITIYSAIVNTINIGDLADVNFNMQYSRIGQIISNANYLVLYPSNTNIGYVNLESGETRIGNLSNTSFNYIKIGKGKTLSLDGGTTLRVAHLDAIGDSGFPITIQSGTSGTRANISKTSGTECFSYLNISDINATGGASFIAGPSSSDISNNSGWDFVSSCNPIGATFVQPYCTGDDLSLLAIVPANVTGFLWNGPQSFISNSQNPVISGPASNEGMYTLQAGGETRQILVYQSQSASDFISINTQENYITHIEYGQTSNANYYTYQWYENGVLIPDATNGIYYPTENGTYYTTIDNGTGCVTQSISVNFTLSNVLDTPTTLVGVLVGMDGELTWEDNASAETAYVVERSLMSGSGFIVIATLPANSVSYTDLNISPSTEYYYRVRALNATQYSAYSNEAVILLTAISVDHKAEISIYPMPVQNELQLSFSIPSTEATSIVISDLSGRTLLQKEIPSETIVSQTDVSFLENGMYILRVVSGDNVKLLRFVKRAE